MGLGVVVFSVLVVSPIQSFDPIEARPSESFGTPGQNRISKQLHLCLELDQVLVIN